MIVIILVYDVFVIIITLCPSRFSNPVDIAECPKDSFILIDKQGIISQLNGLDIRICVETSNVW